MMACIEKMTKDELIEKIDFFKTEAEIWLQGWHSDPKKDKRKLLKYKGYQHMAEKYERVLNGK